MVTNKNIYDFDAVVIATGGKSYSSTGSLGDGYKFAKSFGHDIVDVKPALCAIELKNDFIKKVQGLSLKNVQLSAKNEDKKISFFGDMLFTDKGISGPIVLSISSYINRSKKIELTLDFKPALTVEKLNERMLREFEKAKNKDIKTVMKTLLPINFVEIFLNKCEIDCNKKINSIKQAERVHIINQLKAFKLDFKGLYPLDTAIITSGGVDRKQINPKTMESKIVQGLYFIGEVLDIDALTGGYNLQLAFSTAYCCADSI